MEGKKTIIDLTSEGDGSMERIDENDRKILWMLQLDSRTPLREMGKVTRLSQSAVKKRIDDLIEKGVIRNFTIIVNSSRLAEESVVVARVKCNPRRKREVALKLSNLDEITEVYTGLGEYNILAKIRCAGGAKIEEILQRINHIEDISDVDVFPALSRIKEEPGMKILSGAMINEQDVDGDGVSELVLTNPYIRVVVDPASGGRVKEYVLKKNWSNNVQSESGLLSDSFLESTWDLSRVAFDYEKVQHSINEATLRLWTKTEKPRIPGLILEKKCALSATSEEFKITYKLVNASKDEKILTLWIRNYIQIGESSGPTHHFVTPTSSKAGVLTEEFERVLSGKIFVQGGHKLTPFDLERWKDEKNLKWPEGKISEGWATYVDRNSNVAFGMIWDPKEVRYIKRYFIYDHYSIELVFETVKLEPKESKEFSFTIISSSDGWRKIRDHYIKAIKKPTARRQT